MPIVFIFDREASPRDFKQFYFFIFFIGRVGGAYPLKKVEHENIIGTNTRKKHMSDLAENRDSDSGESWHVRQFASKKDLDSAQRY